MPMTTTGEPLNLSAPAADDTPGWVADFAGNARKTNNFAKEVNEKIGDIEALATTHKNLVMSINEVKSSSETQDQSLEESIKKIDESRLVSLDEIDLVTEPGFYVDAQAVAELNRNFDSMFEVITQTKTQAVTKGVNGYVSFNASAPSGYTLFGVRGYSSHASTMCGQVIAGNNAYTLPFVAYSTDSAEKFTLRLTFIKTTLQ